MNDILAWRVRESPKKMETYGMRSRSFAPWLLVTVAIGGCSNEGVADGILFKRIKGSVITGLTSEQFKDGDTIPPENSGPNGNRTPSLTLPSWPTGTKSVALAVEDPDAPGAIAVHWLLILPPDAKRLESGAVPATWPTGANYTAGTGYAGPNPPPGSGPHHYHFQVLALDRVPELTNGYSRDQLAEAIRGHVLAKADLVGLYETP